MDKLHVPGFMLFMHADAPAGQCRCGLGGLPHAVTGRVEFANSRATELLVSDLYRTELAKRSSSRSPPGVGDLHSWYIALPSPANSFDGHPSSGA